MPYKKAKFVSIRKNAREEWTCELKDENNKQINFKPGKELSQNLIGQEVDVEVDLSNAVLKVKKGEQILYQKQTANTNPTVRQGNGGNTTSTANNTNTLNRSPAPVCRPVDNDSYTNYLLPSDTQQLGFVNNENLHLFYNKLLKTDAKSKFSLKDATHLGGKLGTVLSGALPKINYQALVDKYYQVITKLPGYTFSGKMNKKLSYAMAMGLGDSSVYETALTLHPVYGVPYIRASAIKGVVRSFVIQSYFMEAGFDGKDPKKDRAEENAFADLGFCELFGSPKESKKGEYQGELVFFDALPQNDVQVGLDIMTPHYGPYYAEKKAAGDYYDPVPVTFPVVTKGTFGFVVGVQHKRLNFTETVREGMFSQGLYQGKTKLEIGQVILEAALQSFGLGAKTALGYGIFKD